MLSDSVTQALGEYTQVARSRQEQTNVQLLLTRHMRRCGSEKGLALHSLCVSLHPVFQVLRRVEAVQYSVVAPKSKSKSTYGSS
jgi:hypothetical protein